MPHVHPVYDSDTHFVIDPISRSVTNAQSKKTILMQNDHNSEQFTFEIGRYVEGHDMTLCDRVEVHYININSANRDKNAGVYEVQDLKLAPEDNSRVIFTWMVSQNATMHPGPLNFLIIFACTEEGNVTYRWSTGINNSITISAGINNGEVIEELYPDILAQWAYGIYEAYRDQKAEADKAFNDQKAEVDKAFTDYKASLDGTMSKWEKDIYQKNFAYEAALKHGFVGTEEEWLASMRADLGIHVGPTEPLAPIYFWFNTSNNAPVGDVQPFFVLGTDDNASVFMNVDGKKYSLDNGTLEKEVTSSNQYNFDII